MRRRGSPIPDRKPTSVVLPAVVVALVLLGVYVGAYYWACRPMRGGAWWRDGLPGHPRHWDSFFYPMIEIDRHIRPGVWDPDWPPRNRKT